MRQRPESRNILTVLLHDGQEADDDLRARADEHLALSPALSIDHVVEGIG
jgi:hypothetical protein